MYMFKFFETKEEARAFQREQGGAMYSNVKGSRTKRDYAVERAMMQDTSPRPTEWFDQRPYVIAWNA